MQNESKAGDLTTLAKTLEAVIENHFRLKERPSMAIAFSLPPDFQDVHWVTNIARADGIKLFQETAKKMIAQTN
jgi:hypothetical protein